MNNHMYLCHVGHTIDRKCYRGYKDKVNYKHRHSQNNQIQQIALICGNKKHMRKKTNIPETNLI
jgi:hypothetical protein